MTNPRTPVPCGGSGVDARPARRPDTTATDPQSGPAQLRRRRAASWRCEPLPGGSRDPWADRHSARWTAAELDSWRNTVEHLRANQLYGRWQVPESVRMAWRRRLARRRGGDAT